MAVDPATGIASRSSLATWVERISTAEMPIFGHTVQQIVAVAEDDEAPARRLAQVVLQDPSMTARTLKLVNSPFYNPRERTISTVSHAVVLLGFNTVRDLCLSIALVDAFMQGTPRERFNHELARSIHAAVQARALAVKMGDDSPEEVFIAALLYHLGDLAFWCFSGETGEALDTLQHQPGFRPGDAEEEVLGFRLHQLTGELVREWRINELLNHTLVAPDAAGPRGRAILLCHQLAAAAEQGWEHRET
ncbi:MAG TPA: HDOD domain-containing protein, partial [Geothrix sp.]|nr:HDOD domain-containing protein [Geothrix sp.]